MQLLCTIFIFKLLTTNLADTIECDRGLNDCVEKNLFCNNTVSDSSGCKLQCTDRKSCFNTNFTCSQDTSCEVTCSGEESCKAMSIFVTAPTIIINCNGDNACNGMSIITNITTSVDINSIGFQINCAADVDASCAYLTAEVNGVHNTENKIYCGPATDSASCLNTTIYCNTGHCEIECAENAMSCQNNKMYCNDAATCSARGEYTDNAFNIISNSTTNILTIFTTSDTNDYEPTHTLDATVVPTIFTIVHTNEGVYDINISDRSTDIEAYLIGAGIGILLVIIVMIAIFIVMKKCKKRRNDVKKPDDENMDHEHEIYLSQIGLRQKDIIINSNVSEELYEQTEGVVKEEQTQYI